VEVMRRDPAATHGGRAMSVHILGSDGGAMKLAGRGAAFEPKAPAPAPVPEGHLLAGKYRIERVIGAGGMGVVVAATHIHIGQRVAIKFLLPHAQADAHAMARFAREARALAQIESEHVGRVIDVGVLDEGQPYMVLECLTGRNLAEVMATRGALDIDEATAYVLEACQAMAEAHALGIIHRDLKPENLFLAERADGSRIIKVIDFGVSKIRADMAFLRSVELVTVTSAVVGSPLYMSPEQLRAARDVDARTDIWSLGVTLYELLTGQGPFRWSTLPELCAAILKDPPRPLRELRADVPEALEAVVMRCLAKEPALRPASAGVLAQELWPFAMPGVALAMSHISPAARSVREPCLPSSGPCPRALPSRSSETPAPAPLSAAARPAERSAVAHVTQRSSAAPVAPEPTSDHPFEGQMRASTLTPPIGLSTVASVPPRKPLHLRAVKTGLVALIAFGAGISVILTASPTPPRVITQAARAQWTDGAASASAPSASAKAAPALPTAAPRAAEATPIVATAGATAPPPTGRKPNRAAPAGATKGPKAQTGRSFRPSFPQSAFDQRK
jgi:eukaryotic-like serine/threonine-protein kinase